MVVVWLCGVRADATTYYTDGDCGTSGTGTSLTCGAGGPFKTICEGVAAMSAGDTLNMRGAHGVFDGRYHEYLGLWGTNGDANPCKSLDCTDGNPCVIQGCPASACGSDETAIVTGLVQRTDWTDEGGGRWSRAMEARTGEFSKSDENYLSNSSDPGFILEGALGSQVHMPYGTFCTGGTNAGDTCLVAAHCPGGGSCDLANLSDGRWVYDAAGQFGTANRAYINPTGAGNPNSGGATVWVPDLEHIAAVSGAPSETECPDSSCPDFDRVTFRRLIFEGGRWTTFSLIPTGQSIAGGDPATFCAKVAFSDVSFRYFTRFGLIANNCLKQLDLTNVTVEDYGRGSSWDGTPAGSESSFGLRLFSNDSGTWTNIIARRCGNSGDDNNHSGLGGNKTAPWLTAPWNDVALNMWNRDCTGAQQKDSRNIALTGLTATDIFRQGYTFDNGQDSTLASGNFSNVRTGIAVAESSGAAGYNRTRNVTITRSIFDNIGLNDSGAIDVFGVTGLQGGEFGVRIMNNIIRRSSFAAIALRTGWNSVQVHNNTIWQNRDQYTGQANTAAAGIHVNVAGDDLDIRNNIFSTMNNDFVLFTDAATSTTDLVANYNVYDALGGMCVVDWGSGADHCKETVAEAASDLGLETNGQEVDPLFLDEVSVPPDLHLSGASPVIDDGVTISTVTSDIDGNARPQGVAWDIGADEWFSAIPQLFGSAVSGGRIGP